MVKIITLISFQSRIYSKLNANNLAQIVTIIKQYSVLILQIQTMGFYDASMGQKSRNHEFKHSESNFNFQELQNYKNIISISYSQYMIQLYNKPLLLSNFLGCN